MSKGATKDYNVNSEIYVKSTVKSIISFSVSLGYRPLGGKELKSHFGKSNMERLLYLNVGTSPPNSSHLKKALQQFLVQIRKTVPHQSYNSLLTDGCEKRGFYDLIFPLHYKVRIIELEEKSG